MIGWNKTNFLYAFSLFVKLHLYETASNEILKTYNYSLNCAE